MTSVQDFEALEQYAFEAGESSPPPRGAAETEPEVEVTRVAEPQHGQSLARTVAPAQSTPHPSPTPVQTGPAKRGRSSEQATQKGRSSEQLGRKKQKGSGGHEHVRSPNLNLLGLTDQDCARFKEKPFEVVADMMKAAGELFGKYQQAEVDRLEEVREERDSLAQRLKELDPQIKALADNEKKLREAEEQLVTQVSARTEAEAARAGLEAALAEATTTRDKALAEKARYEVDAEREIRRLMALNKDLHAKNASLTGDLETMEQQRNQLDAKFKDVVKRAKGAADFQFENAVSQVKLLHPNIVVDPNLVSGSHRVDGREIVRPEKVVKGQVVQERAVIYRAGDQ